LSRTSRFVAATIVAFEESKLKKVRTQTANSAMGGRTPSAVLNGHLGVLSMLTDFFIPVPIGNVIGGTALFALITYAQVMQEI
jgi:hypothetical protein